MADDQLSIVRASAWQALLRRMDAAVARDGRLAEARDTVLRPVDLLRAMAVDAHGALADDVLRADRLRALLFVAWPYVAVTLEAKRLLAAKAPPASPDTSVLAAVVKSSTSHELGWPVIQAYEPGVIDHAGLVVLALAAARVADPPFAPVFVASVHGLALAASSAEVLGRLDPRQPDVEPLEVVLAALYAIAAAGALTRNEFLRPFALDPVERGRWSCLAEILDGPLLASAIRLGRGWDGATSDEILEVTPKLAAAKQTVTVRVRGGDPLGDATVVFASPGAPLHPATASSGATKKDVTPVSVVVPAGASPGWIGFSRKKLIAASNKARAGLREQLAAVLALPCVDGVGHIDPEVSLPDYGVLATPRRRGLNRFEGGMPAVVFADTAPERVRAGQPFDVRWETAGADAAEIHFAGVAIDDAPPTGVHQFPAPMIDGDVVIEIRARATRGSTVVRSDPPWRQNLHVDVPVKIAKVEVTQRGQTAPLIAQRELAVGVQLTMPAVAARAQLLVAKTTLEPTALEAGRVTFAVPANLVVDGMTMYVTVEDREGARDSQSIGPLAMRALGAVEIVLVRPAIVAASRIDDPLAIAAAHERVIGAAAEAGVSATIIDLPWADDELAALAARPGSDADPLLARVLEALSRRALLTPRFEHAIWLALLPDPSGAGTAAKLPKTMLAASTPLGSIARSVPANAARAVAVATPRGLARLFDQLFAAPAAPAITVGQRLAIVGSLDEHSITIEDMRVDERGAGPGAPNLTTFEVATLDASGRELDVLPIRALATTQPVSLAMLVPVSPAVASLELRSKDGLIHKVLRRTPGDLTIEVPKGSQKAFEWKWKHSGNARPTASVLLRRDRLETPVLDVDPCHAHVDLPIWRYAGADEIRLYATDGWNADETAVSENFANDATVVLRKLSDGRFFADAPDGWSLTWVVDGTTKQRDARTYQLAADDKGLLELVAKRGKSTIREAVTLDR